jgi:hypothetical protein
MQVKIHHRWNTEPCAVEIVPDNCDNPMRAAIIQAVARGADLIGADLTRANLTGANLTNANLTNADLTGADLTGANLAGASLTDANFTDASFTSANLTRADLAVANLTRADFTGANLTGANLAGASLTDARQDFRLVLDAAPNEVSGLLLALREGRIDGTQYEGECACLKGTIANIRHCDYRDLGDADALRPDSKRPSERLFMGISPGHLPSINHVAKIVEGWILEWQAERASA